MSSDFDLVVELMAFVRLGGMAVHVVHWECCGFNSDDFQSCTVTLSKLLEFYFLWGGCHFAHLD